MALLSKLILFSAFLILLSSFGAAALIIDLPTGIQPANTCNVTNTLAWGDIMNFYYNITDLSTIESSSANCTITWTGANGSYSYTYPSNRARINSNSFYDCTIGPVNVDRGSALADASIINFSALYAAIVPTGNVSYITVAASCVKSDNASVSGSGSTTWIMNEGSYTGDYYNSCGNNVVESGELCDGSDLNGRTCSGLFAGTLSCSSDCNYVDSSACAADFSSYYHENPGSTEFSEMPIFNGHGISDTNEQVGQTFTIDTGQGTYGLWKIATNIHSDIQPGNPIRMSVYATSGGMPTGSALAFAQINQSIPSDCGARTTFYFSGESLTLIDGVKYAWVASYENTSAEGQVNLTACYNTEVIVDTYNVGELVYNEFNDAQSFISDDFLTFNYDADFRISYAYNLAGNNTCSVDADCPVCQKCAAGSCVNQHQEDTKNECTLAVHSCTNPYTIFYDGDFCMNGACLINASDYVDNGNVCVNSSHYNVNPSDNNNCGIWSDCVLDAVNASEYYVGYSLVNLGQCTDTDWQTKGSTWSANSGWKVSLTQHADTCQVYSPGNDGIVITNTSGGGGGSIEIVTNNTANITNATDVVIQDPGVVVVNFSGRPVTVNDLPNGSITVFSDQFKTRIYIDSSAVPGLNQAAKITMYQINSNYQIRKDGVLCTPPGVGCNVMSYTASGGVLVFNVTGFSSYQVDHNGDYTGYTIPDIANIIVDGMGTFMASIVSWIEILILVGVLWLGVMMVEKYR